MKALDAKVLLISHSDLTEGAKKKVEKTKQNWFITINDVKDQTSVNSVNLVIYSKRVLKSTF